MNDDKKYWLAFSACPGIGPLRFKALLEYFGSAEEAWRASKDELIKIGLGGKLICQFDQFRQKFSFEKYYSIIKRKDIRVLTLLDCKYPTLLREISDPPFVLYYRGDLKKIKDFKKTIAVVGTRRMTSYGREATKRVVEGLVCAGLTIVSGMAYGIDTVAHNSAIEAGGTTIAVLGGGVDYIHPKSNTTLYWQIIKKAGIVISEYPPLFQPSKTTFPQRNRIISGLSLGVVVTEGAQRSGTLITASHAASQGREVFAVPGPITSRFSAATSILLKQGAELVTEASDILDELNINIKNQKAKNKDADQGSKSSLTGEEKIISDLLEGENLHFDDIVQRSGIEAKKLGSILTIMEMKGYIKNLGSGIYKTVSCSLPTQLVRIS